MAMSTAKTVAAYLKDLPPERRSAVSAVRTVIKKHLPKGYVEGMQWGVIAYYVPLKRFPDTYNGKPLCIAGIGSQKQYMAVYLMGVYGSPALDRWFRTAYKASGKKLDMGKSCVRFKSLDHLPLDLIGEAVAKVSVDELVAMTERLHPKMKRA